MLILTFDEHCKYLYRYFVPNKKNKKKIKMKRNNIVQLVNIK